MYVWAWLGMAAIILFMGGHGCNLKGKCRALDDSECDIPSSIF